MRSTTRIYGWELRWAATLSTVLLVFLIGSFTPAAGVVGGVTTDEWDQSMGAIVTAHSGTLSGDNPLDMFGTAGGVEGANLLFRDFAAAGTVHFVEWQTTANKTIRSFNLSANHDGHGVAPAGQCDLPTFRRDAQHRGFDRFTLYAYNTATGMFDIVLYDMPIPLGDDNGDHPGENAKLYDPAGALRANKDLLDISANVPAVTADRWRAEFTQVGCASNESGPRIIELDGFLDPLEEPGLTKELTSGPDVDGNDEIDLVVEVGQSTTTAYDFTMTYDNPGGPPVLIQDTAPAEWQVTEVQGMAVTDGFLGPVSDGNGGDGEVVVFPANREANNRSATKIDWTPDPGVNPSSLLVDMTTRVRPAARNPKFAPTSCGALYLNDDEEPAAAFELDPATGEPVRDPLTGELLPALFEAGSLCVAAVADINGGGLIRDGSGDEDGDTLSDLDEACTLGTNPCNADTDGDGIPDNLDEDPF